MIEEHQIQITKTARYFTLGVLNDQTTHIWVVCHGYRQLANYFIQNFKELPPTHFVVAPEGLHRFYLNGYDGRVGASWMTSEDRLNDIKDYVAYLDHLCKTIISQTNTNPKIVCFGFSQGGATVTRWACQGNTNISDLILWSTVYPPDLNFEVDKSKLNKMNLQLVIGDNDEFLSEETINTHVTKLDQLGIEYKLSRFIGEHKIEGNLLLDMAHLL